MLLNDDDMLAVDQDGNTPFDLATLDARSPKTSAALIEKYGIKLAEDNFVLHG